MVTSATTPARTPIAWCSNISERVVTTNVKIRRRACRSPNLMAGNRRVPVIRLRFHPSATRSRTTTRSNSVSCLQCVRISRPTPCALRRTAGCGKRTSASSARMKSSTSGNRTKKTKSSAGSLNQTGKLNSSRIFGESWKRTSHSSSFIATMATRSMRA
jgi:hypothetical protein